MFSEQACSSKWYKKSLSSWNLHSNWETVHKELSKWMKKVTEIVLSTMKEISQGDKRQSDWKRQGGLNRYR